MTRFPYPKASLAVAVAVLFVAVSACEVPEPDAPAEASAAAEAEEVARQYLRAYNERDMEALEGLLADRLELNGEPIDRDAALEMIEGYMESFPDSRYLEPLIVGAEGWATVHLEFEATGAGEFLGHDVDGREVRVSEMLLFSIRDGRIHEFRYEWDELGFWTQLGVVEDPYPQR